MATRYSKWYRKRVMPACLLSLLCLGGIVSLRGQSAGATRVDRVLLVQLDGLTPAILREYLVSIGPGPVSALRRLLAVSTTDIGHISFGSALEAETALTVIPSISDAASATLLTGAPPRVHGVRGSKAAISPGITTLHQVIVASGFTSASAGFPYAAGATFDASGADDESRMKSLLDWLETQRDKRPRLITVRFESSGGILASTSGTRALEAIARADRLLDHLLYGRGAYQDESTLTFITSGHGNVRLPDRVITARLTPKGTKIFINGGSVIARSAFSAEEASGMSDFALLLNVQGGHVQVLDPQLEGWRRPTAVEEERIPALQERAANAIEEGETLLLAHRDETRSVEFLPAGSDFTGYYLGHGGASPDESIVSFVLAGEPLRALRGARLGQIVLEQVAPTILDVLGLDPDRLGNGRKTASLFPRLSSANTPLAAQPAAPEQEWAALDRCWRALALGKEVVQTCKSLLDRTSDRQTAGEALLALTIDGVRTGRLPASRLAAQRALVIAAWLAPNLSFPKDDAGLKPLWPAAKTQCSAAGGIAVLLDGEAERYGIAAREAASRLSGAAGLIETERSLPVTFCALPMPLGDSVVTSEYASQLVGRFLGAQLILWGEVSPNPEMHIAGFTPMLPQWLGPPAFHELVAQAPFPTPDQLHDGATPVPGVAALAAYLHFVRGIHAFHRGQLPLAREHLKAANRLSPNAAAWRDAILKYVTDDPVEAGKPAQDRTVAKQWADSVGLLLGRLRPDDSGVALFLSRLTRRNTWNYLLSANLDMGKPASSLALHDQFRRDLSAAENSYKPVSSFCQADTNTQATLRSLAAAGQSMEQFGNRGMAAVLRLRRIPLLSPTDQAEEVAPILRLLEDPGAGWVRADALTLIAELTSGGTDAPGLPTWLQDRLDDEVLWSIKRQVADDRFKGFKDRNLARLMVLLRDRRSGAAEQRRLAIEEIRDADGELIATTMIRNAWKSAGMLTTLFFDHRLLTQIYEDIRMTQRQEADGKLRPEDRMAMRVLELWGALIALDGNTLDDALTSLSRADPPETSRELVQRVAAVRKEQGRDTESLELAGPWARIAARFGKAWIHAKYQKDYARAHSELEDAVEVIRLMLEYQVAADAVVVNQLNRLTAVLPDAMLYAIVDSDSSKDPAAARQRQDSLTALIKLVKQLNGQISGHGAIRQYSRVLVLIEIILKDLAWFGQPAQAKKLPEQIRARDSADQKFVRLIKDWEDPQMDGHLENGELKKLLRIMLAGQLFLRSVPQIRTDGDWAAMFDPSRLAGELKTLVGSIRHTFPEAEIHRMLLQDDDVRGVVLDFVVTWLDWVAKSVRKVVRGEFTPMGEVVAHFQQQLKKFSGRENSEAGGLTAHLLGWWLAGDDKWKEEIDAWEAGRSVSGDKFFGEFRFLWDLLEFDPMFRLGRISDAERVLQHASAACPAIDWELELGRMRLAAAKGDVKGAYDALDRYITRHPAGDRGFHRIDTKTHYQAVFVYADYETSYTASGLLFQPDAKQSVSYGMRSKSETKPSQPAASASAKGTSVGITPSGSDAAALQTALLLKAWIALRAGDDATAGRTIADLLSATGYYSESRVPGDAVTVERGSTESLADARLAMWVATLAELRGHRRLAGDLMALVKSDTMGSTRPQSIRPKSWFQFSCSENSEMKDSSPNLSWMIVCDPTALLWQEDLEPFQNVVELRARRLLGEFVADAEWVAAIAKLNEADPKAVPRWAIGLDRAWRAGGDVKLLPPAAGAAALVARADLGEAGTLPDASRQGLGCEAALVRFRRRRGADAATQLLGDACGSPRIVAEAYLRPAPTQLKDAVARLDRLVRLIEEQHRNAAPVRMPVAESEALGLLRSRQNDAQAFSDPAFPDVLRKLSERAEHVSWRQIALALRAYAVAAEIHSGIAPREPADQLFAQGQRWHLGPSRYTLLLDHLAYRAAQPEDQKTFVRAFIDGTRP